MTQMQTIKLNGGLAIPKGSKPPSLEYQYLDENNDPVDLSIGSWTGQARAEQLHVDSQPLNIGTGSVSVNTANATATYNWHESDFSTPGRFLLIIWIGNGTQRFGSVVFEWVVSDAPGADPTV